MVPEPSGKEFLAATLQDRLAAIEGLYAALPDGWSASLEDRAQIVDATGPDSDTYGEILPEGSRRLLAWLDLQVHDELHDLGSGIGRIPIQAVLTTSVGRVIGTELSADRHDIAMRARQRLLSALPPSAAQGIRKRLEFRQGDLRNADLSQASVAFLGATCFTQDLINRVARSLASSNMLRALLVTKPLSELVRQSFSERGSMVVPTSWSPRVRVHVYGPRHPQTR